MSIFSRLAHGWNAFHNNRDPTPFMWSEDLGYSSSYRPDRPQLRFGNERSIIASIYNRISIDVAAIKIKHVRTDENDRYAENIKSRLNNCITLEANIDQTSRAFIQDAVTTMFDVGHVCIVPIDTSNNPDTTGSYDIWTMRTGKVMEWFPRHVRISVYNDRKGIREEILMDKQNVGIITNPLYAVMNESNSTLQRLIRKLNILDSIDEQSGSGKLDIILQLPYVVKNEIRKREASERKKLLEEQLTDSKYGVAYIDGTERITQLNRPAENHLMAQITYLTSMLFSQLGLTENVFNGTADEKEMLHYMSTTIEPIISSIVDEITRKFLTQTARTQGQTIMYFNEIFKLVPSSELANVADKYTRNEIMSPNEFREVLGYKPSGDPSSDELRNRNLNAPTTTKEGETTLLKPPPKVETIGDKQESKE